MQTARTVVMEVKISEGVATNSPAESIRHTLQPTEQFNILLRNARRAKHCAPGGGSAGRSRLPKMVTLTVSGWSGRFGSGHLIYFELNLYITTWGYMGQIDYDSAGYDSASYDSASYDSASYAQCTADAHL